MIKNSSRSEYFACHLTLRDREKLKAEAKRRSATEGRKVSMSELAADFISKGLADAPNQPLPRVPLENE